MDITLKNIKHAAFASQETHCFTASVYLDGKPFCTEEKHSMTQQEFYALQEVQEQLDIQKCNPHGSTEHKAAYEKIGEIAKDHSVFDQYQAAGGGIY